MDYHEVEEKEGSEKEAVIGAVAAPSNVEEGEIETLEPDHSQERSDRGNKYTIPMPPLEKVFDKQDRAQDQYFLEGGASFDNSYCEKIGNAWLEDELDPRNYGTSIPKVTADIPECVSTTRRFRWSNLKKEMFKPCSKEVKNRFKKAKKIIYEHIGANFVTNADMRYYEKLLSEIKMREPNKRKRNFEKEITKICDMKYCKFDLLMLVHQLRIKFLKLKECKRNAILNSDTEQYKLFNRIIRTSFIIFSKPFGYSTNREDKNLFDIKKTKEYFTLLTGDATLYECSNLATKSKYLCSDMEIVDGKVGKVLVNTDRIHVKTNFTSNNIKNFSNSMKLSKERYFETVFALMREIPPRWYEQIFKICTKYTFNLSRTFDYVMNKCFSIRNSTKRMYERWQHRLAIYLSPKNERYSINDFYNLIMEKEINIKWIGKFFKNMAMIGYNIRTIHQARSAILHGFRMRNWEPKIEKEWYNTFVTIDKAFGTPIEASVALPNKAFTSFIEHIRKEEKQETHFYKLIKCMAIFMLRSAEATNLEYKDLEIRYAGINKASAETGYTIKINVGKTIKEWDEAQIVTIEERRTPQFRMWDPKILFYEIGFQNNNCANKPGKIFEQSNGEKWNTRKINALLKKHWKTFTNQEQFLSFKNDKFTSHGCRISMFTILHTMGLDSVEIQTLARHRVAESTKYYLDKGIRHSHQNRGQIMRVKRAIENYKKQTRFSNKIKPPKIIKPQRKIENSFEKPTNHNKIIKKRELQQKIMDLKEIEKQNLARKRQEFLNRKKEIQNRQVEKKPEEIKTNNKEITIPEFAQTTQPEKDKVRKRKRSLKTKLDRAKKKMKRDRSTYILDKVKQTMSKEKNNEWLNKQTRSGRTPKKKKFDDNIIAY